MEMVKNEGIAKVLKGLGVWKTTGARATKTVYCDPYIWVLLAMELNPKIYAEIEKTVITAIDNNWIKSESDL